MPLRKGFFQKAEKQAKREQGVQAPSQEEPPTVSASQEKATKDRPATTAPENKADPNTQPAFFVWTAQGKPVVQGMPQFCDTEDAWNNDVRPGDTIIELGCRNYGAGTQVTLSRATPGVDPEKSEIDQLANLPSMRQMREMGRVRFLITDYKGLEGADQ